SVSQSKDSRWMPTRSRSSMRSGSTIFAKDRRSDLGRGILGRVAVMMVSPSTGVGVDKGTLLSATGWANRTVPASGLAGRQTDPRSRGRKREDHCRQKTGTARKPAVYPAGTLLAIAQTTLTLLAPPPDRAFRQSGRTQLL